MPIPKPLISAPPTRRAFSAVMTRPSLMSAGLDDDDEDERSSDFEVDMNSPAQRAQAARRENVGRLGNRTRPNSRIDPSPLSSSSRNTFPGLPGFGDSEADGKILPCHKLHDLMGGVYDSLIENYIIIDCRFDYEHNGGHIPGSINLNTNDAIEEYLLSSDKPPCSRSGDGMGKTILIFHCEFSVKRAPTFAKHLRSKDRSMNGHVYPKIHYPEVYESHLPEVIELVKQNEIYVGGIEGLAVHQCYIDTTCGVYVYTYCILIDQGASMWLTISRLIYVFDSCK